MVDDLYTKSQHEGDKHVDALYRNSQDGYENTILDVDDLYTKSQDKDNQHVHYVDYLYTKLNTDVLEVDDIF